MTGRRMFVLAAVVAATFVWGFAVPAGAQSYGSSRFTDVTAIAPDDAWAVGSYPGMGEHRRTFTQHWDGSSWSDVPSPSPLPNSDELFAVGASSATNVWAVGVATTRAGVWHPLVLRLESGTWTQIPLPPGTRMSVVDLAVRGPRNVWLLANHETGDGASVLRWNGASWQTLPAPKFDVGEAIAAAPGAGTWLAGFDQSPYPRTPITAHWTGSDWKMSPAPGVAERDTFVGDLVIRAPGDVVLVGTSWRDIASDWDPRWYALRFDEGRWSVERDAGSGTLSGATTVPGSGQVVSVGQSRPAFANVVLVRNSEVWNRVPTPRLAESYLVGVTATGPNDMWAVGWTQHGEGPLILHGDGTSWARVPAAATPS